MYIAHKLVARKEGITICWKKTYILSITRVGSRIFIGGGGGEGAKCYVPARTLRARNRTPFRQGSRARWRGPGNSRVILMLSRAIWALFLSILIFKKMDKKHSWSNFRGARAFCAPPPLDPPLYYKFEPCKFKTLAIAKPFGNYLIYLWNILLVFQLSKRCLLGRMNCRL